jgi:flagellar basal body-associated protein FliL
MGLLEKLENAVNRLLLLIGELILRGLKKLVPPKVQALWTRALQWLERVWIWIKNSPQAIKAALPGLIGGIKSSLMAYDYKAKLIETCQAAMDQYVKSQPGAKLSGFKKVLMAPFLIIGQWISGLTGPQTLVLMGFTAASFLSAITMFSSGQRLLSEVDQGRTPASMEEDISYDRPDYYKKQTRHLDLTNIRLPVYFANVNEVKSVDIDFSATLSNRSTRMRLEELEFQLRDHLILNIEPMVAVFPLEEEGKVILRDKLIIEINDFMKANELEGEVKDLKIIYILAN